jgi:hypothetical protein
MKSFHPIVVLVLNDIAGITIRRIMYNRNPAPIDNKTTTSVFPNEPVNLPKLRDNQSTNHTTAARINAKSFIVQRE